MAKFQEKIQAINLRKQGYSLREISKLLNISKGTISLWTREVTLSDKILDKLKLQQIRGGITGRLKGAYIQKQRRLEEIETLRKQGIFEIGLLNQRDKFIAGIALFWGEGTKSFNRCEIANSDPKMVLFMLDWFKNYCKVNQDEFICQIQINETHKERIEKIQSYWSKLIGIPENQFMKPLFIHSISKKIYSNHDNYFGTFRLRIKKPSKIQRKILGWIEGLHLAG